MLHERQAQLDQSENSLIAHYNLGICLRTFGKMDDALYHFEKVVSQSSKLSEEQASASPFNRDAHSLLYGQLGMTQLLTS
mmetsp:Transcript_41671/g.30019  ORF Transcript_41671/g.30019 Transcript_41671/m.30019 type:complete len:80 (+) Transcript_41671:1318-1557(+)